MGNTFQGMYMHYSVFKALHWSLEVLWSELTVDILTFLDYYGM